jgi:hypothetical protein
MSALNSYLFPHQNPHTGNIIGLHADFLDRCAADGFVEFGHVRRLAVRGDAIHIAPALGNEQHVGVGDIAREDILLAAVLGLGCCHLFGDIAGKPVDIPCGQFDGAHHNNH